MNFKNATENTTYFKTYYLQGLLFAFHETTRNSKILKIPNEFHIIIVRFHILKIKYFLQL